MAPIEVHLKSGRAARTTTQITLVKGQQRDLKRRTSKLFMEITHFTKKNGEGSVNLPETLRQEFFKQWERLEFLRKNLEELKSEWEKYKVPAAFPLETKRLDTYQTAEETISNFMATQGIKEDSYPSTMNPHGGRTVFTANEETDEHGDEEEERGRATTGETGKTSLQHLFGVKTPAGVTRRRKRPFSTTEISSDEEDVDLSGRMSHSQLFAKVGSSAKKVTKSYRDIPSFSGEYLDFPEFLDMFRLTVHCAELADPFKLNYLRLKLDDRTLRMIQSYRGKDYEKALLAVIEEYTSIASVISHIRKRAQDLPQVRDPDDLDTLTEVVGQLRSITSLFEHYRLDTGLEMEIFRVFVQKVPRSYNERYMRRVKFDVPSLEMYLSYLDEGIATARTRALWYPPSKGETRKSSNGGRQTTSIDRRNFDTQRDCTYARYTAQPQGDQDWAEEEDFNQHRPPQRRVESSRDSPLADRACLQVNRLTRDDRRQFRDRQPGPIQTGLRAERRGTTPGATDNHAPEPSEEDQKDVRFPCKACGHPSHSRLYCPKVSPQEKWKIAKVLSLCFVCFSKQHTTDDCSLRYNCAKCGGRHSIYLCPDREAKLPTMPAQANMVKAEPRRSAAELDANWSPTRYNDSLRDFHNNDWGFDEQPDGHIMRVIEEPPQRSTSRLLGPWRNARPE
ncbi:hypothetical protein TYRP_022922 [Tyrophagus putrescentiae]|nr:hypothetical protein TYRP_022922 [Tyrophagus putrescentiae]